MILCADKPAERGNLDNLHKTGVRVLAHAFHAGLFETCPIVVVELKAVAVTLLNLGGSVGLCGTRTRGKPACIGAEPHGASHVVYALLLLHEVDDIVRGIVVHLGGVGLTESEDVAGKLDDHALHAETYAECGDVIGTAPFESHKLSLYASLAESGGYDHAVKTVEHVSDIAAVDLLGMNISQFKPVVKVSGGMEEGLVYALVGVLKFHVFSHKPYGDLPGGRVHLGKESAPRAEIRLSGRSDPHLAEHYLVKMLLMHEDGNLVDRRGIAALHNGVWRNIAELRYLATHGWRDFVFGAQDEHVGLYAELLELLDRVLCRLGLQLLGRRDVRHVREVYAQTVGFKLPTQLADGFEERKAFDISHHAPYLGNHEIKVASLAKGHDIALYLVSDMWDYLHRLSQVVAPALLVNHAAVDTSCGDIVGTCGAYIGEPLIVAKVKVCLMAVNGDIAFPVLVGVPGSMLM